MIAVIADDFTGAAELAGIGLRRGWKVEVVTAVPEHTEADLLVVATDTRSMSQAAAVSEMEKVTRQVQVLQPEWTYKKVDSVLRGHIVAEMEVQMKVLGLRKGLLIPANPLLGRTIRKGQYFLHGQPVHTSSFSIDPEFPIRSSLVSEMLGGRMPKGVRVGNVETVEDLVVWARQRDASTFLAGASGFFSALLGGVDRVKEDVPVPDHPFLFVSGSTFGRSREAIQRVREGGFAVIYLPSDPVIVASLLRERGKVVLAISARETGDPQVLKEEMAGLVKAVLHEVTVGELMIEGGATARAILETVGWHTFYPVVEWSPGVVRMRVQEAPKIHVTVKPGSYDWPPALRSLLNNY